MGLEAQKTVARSVRIAGVGLHSGIPVAIVLQPAPCDHGIVFRRTDIADRPNDIPAVFDCVTPSQLCTSLANRAGVVVQTIEHLMATLAGLHIDNLLVEVEGPELPILDGSAQPFVDAILEVGLTDQRPPRRAIRILKETRVTEGDRWAALQPGDGFSIAFEIHFPSAAIAHRHGLYQVTPASFSDRLAGARTFGFLSEVEGLRRNGLARGGSLDNAVVVDGDAVMNPEGLRFADEFVRHKALDALGDLYLAGAPIIGRFCGHKSGHALNIRLLQALFADRSAWVYVAAVETPDEAGAASGAA